MSDQQVKETVAKYLDEPHTASGEERPLVDVGVRTEAIVDQPDGTVMVHLLVTKIAASASTPVRTPYGKAEEFWTSNTFTPSGSWPVKVRLPSREVSESLEGVAMVGREVQALISEQHRLILKVWTDEETVDKVPGKDVEFDR